MDDADIFRRRFERERLARKQAEAFLESRSRELYLKGVELERAIEAERTARQEVERLSRTDPLTGLFNRRHLVEVVAGEIVRARRYEHELAFAMLDIDHFKHVNDRYGHHTGDAVLAGVAKALLGAVRSTDVAARLGGEEFCVVLPETGLRGAAVACERARVAFAALSFAADDAVFAVTVSIGVTALSSTDAGWEAMARRADAALYEAKARGRNCVVEAR